MIVYATPDPASVLIDAGRFFGDLSTWGIAVLIRVAAGVFVYAYNARRAAAGVADTSDAAES